MLDYTSYRFYFVPYRLQVLTGRERSSFHWLGEQVNLAVLSAD